MHLLMLWRTCPVKFDNILGGGGGRGTALRIFRPQSNHVNQKKKKKK